jgi:hypothetical protein
MCREPRSTAVRIPCWNRSVAHSNNPACWDPYPRCFNYSYLQKIWHASKENHVQEPLFLVHGVKTALISPVFYWDPYIWNMRNSGMKTGSLVSSLFPKDRPGNWNTLKWDMTNHISLVSCGVFLQYFHATFWTSHDSLATLMFFWFYSVLPGKCHFLK